MREKYSYLDFKRNIFLENKTKNALSCQQDSKDFDDNYLGKFLFFATTIYLLLPAILTLFFFSKYPLLVMIAAFLGVVFLVKDSAFKLFSCINNCAKCWPLLILSALIVWLSGILPPFAENSDWYKHYGILNILVDQSWPSSVITEDGVGTLRYSIAYYVIPAIFGKFFSPMGMYVALFIFTTIGLFMAMVLAFGSSLRPSSVLLITGAMFLLQGSSNLPAGFIWNKPGFQFDMWFVFLIVEFLGISISLCIATPRNIPLIFTCVIFLGVLSLFYLGNNNDLLMRASIPALGVLAGLASFAVVYGKHTVPLTLFLLFGLVTPMSEIIRAFTASRLPNPEKINLLDGLPRSYHNQYFVFNGSDGYRRQAILELRDVNFQNTFGTASFNVNNRLIESNEYTDAALVTGDIHLPRGAYKVEATLNWDVESKLPEKNAGHFSLHGKRLLYGINTSREQNKKIISYFNTDGGRLKFSFGLGGWSKGKGFIELKDMHVFAVK